MSEPAPSAAPAVVVMASLPRPGTDGGELDRVLGRPRRARLQWALLARAARWAIGTAPGAAFVALDPADALEEARRLLPPGIDCFAQEGATAAERLTRAAQRVFEVAGGPLLVVGTSLPWLGEYHAHAAIADLRDGCDVVLGVAIGGGLYLLGVRSPQPRLFELAGRTQDGAQTRQLTRQVAQELGLDVGMLHYERALETPEDVRAMLADPLLPPEIAAALRD